MPAPRFGVEHAAGLWTHGAASLVVECLVVEEGVLPLVPGTHLVPL